MVQKLFNIDWDIFDRVDFERVKTALAKVGVDDSVDLYRWFLESWRV